MADLCYTARFLKLKLHSTVLIKIYKLNLHNALWPAADNDPKSINGNTFN